jgi:mRNA interferase RelE/StbE
MNYKIKWSPQSLDFLRKIEKNIAKRIRKKVEQAAQNPKHFLEKLESIHGNKLRIGDYRAIIDLLEKDSIFAVRTIDHRKNIYKKHKIK